MIADAWSDFFGNSNNQQTLIWIGVGVGALIVILFAVALAQRLSGMKTWGTEGTSRTDVKAGCCALPMAVLVSAVTLAAVCVTAAVH